MLVPSSIQNWYSATPREADDMARRRLQQKGDLYEQGGWWKLRWHIYAIGETKPKWSRPVIIGPAKGNQTGLQAWTEKQARREAWEKFLSKLDQNVRVPSSVMTVEQFVGRVYVPEHVLMLRRQDHQRSMLKHVLKPEAVDRIFGVDREEKNPRRKFKLHTVPGWPYLDGIPLRDVTAADAQRIILALHGRGKSWQTSKHVRNIISAIFSEAKRKNFFVGDNPAAGVKLPPKQLTRPPHALTWEQAQSVTAKLASPAKEMAMVSMLLSMNIAEVCGLCWRHVNLADQWATVDGEALPPWTIAVRQQWERRKYGPLKHENRKRNVEIPEALVSVLDAMKGRKHFTGPDDPVFAGRTGKPADEHNYAKRHLKPTGRELGMPWLSWHVFRHTHATLTKIAGMSDADRMKLMGHGSLSMTDRYTHAEDSKRRRTVLNEMATKLIGTPAAKLRRVK